MITVDPEVEIFQGDILAVRGRGWLSDGIAKAEYSKSEPAHGVTHVGLFLAPGNDTSDAVVIEALNRVKTNVLRTSTYSVAHAYVLHDLSLTDLQRSSLLEMACTFSAKDYGWSDLIAQWLSARTGSFWWLDHWPWSQVICSYVVAADYASLRLDFEVLTGRCKPSDIMAFAIAHPEIYRVTQIK